MSFIHIPMGYLMRTPLTRQAAIFANAHFELINHRRKYTNAPYIQHPALVAMMVSSVECATEEMVAAAWLHDSVEDCPSVTIEMIRDCFGPTVAQYVSELTDVSRPEDGNRATRKAIDREHSSRASPEAQTIKYADIIVNGIDIGWHDEDFARVYFKEISLLLDVIPNGDPTLYAQARSCIVVMHPDFRAP